MAARRCTNDDCGIAWPCSFLKPSYMMGGPRYKCPVCQCSTTLLSNVEPLSQNAATFEVFFRTWDRERQDREAQEAIQHLDAEWAAEAA